MEKWEPGVPNFKGARVPPKVVRFKKRMDAKSKEDTEKGKVRRRDKRCRFPLCGCGKFKLALHVSHQQHKGMGGNRTGDRSQPEKMIYLCASRHRENRFAVDRGTVRWRALTDAGADGPVAWDIDMDSLGLVETEKITEDGWYEVARESAPGVLEPLSVQQKSILYELAEMRL